MKEIFNFAAILSFALTACTHHTSISEQYSTNWHTDILGDGYEARYVKQPDDYSGNVRSTIIRKNAKCDSSKHAILYVHGFNDYFFQKEMGDRFVDSCYNFYAVDLRKYGRSLSNGQTPFEARDLKEYFTDIDSALQQIVTDGNKKITLMGHSTGGLITSYYLASNTNIKYPVINLILNSPFLDWNLSDNTENILVPAVTFFSSVLKNVKIKQGGGTGYSHSLLKEYNGEWTYNTEWKLIKSPDVSIGWISAIQKAQQKLQDGKSDVKVPVLLLRSDKSVNGTSWTPEFNKADAVLDVNDIHNYGTKISKSNVTEIVYTDGLHDLILSRKDVREKVYDDIFNWLNK